MTEKQYVTKRVFFVLGLLLPVACQTGDLEVGQQAITPNELEVQLVDSFTVQTATVLADTFATSTDSSVLIGQWNDAQTGQTISRGFTSITYATNDLPDRSGTRFDSLVLVLPMSRAYGDTTQQFTMNIHRLTQTLESKAYYNLNGATYESTPYLTKLVRPWPRYGSRQLRVRLTDALGQAFFDQLRSREISDDETMKTFLRGLAFIGPTAAGSSAPNLMLGLNVSSDAAGLVLYYHDNDINKTQSTLRFPLQGVHFSQVLTDLSQTPLRSLQNRADAVSSVLTKNLTFVNAGGMLRTRLQIPSLDDLGLLAMFRGVNRAELVVEPVRQNARANITPPAQLVLYQSNSLNEELATVPDGQSSSTVSGYYSYDPNDLEQEGSYVFDLTYYINQLLKNQQINRPLLLTVPTTGSTVPVERLAFGDGKNSTYRMRLRLFATMEK